MQFERRTEASAQARLLRPDCNESGSEDMPLEQRSLYLFLGTGITDSGCPSLSLCFAEREACPFPGVQ